MPALLLLLALLCAGARAEPKFRVVWGRRVSQAEAVSDFGFTVSIAACAGQQCTICTGALVAADTVVTAAHCCCDRKRKVRVHGPSHKAFSGANYGMASCRFSRNFRCEHKYFRRDIAVMTLSRPVRHATVVPILCRWPRIGERIFFLGYGDNERGFDFYLRIGMSRFSRCRFYAPKNGPVACMTVKSAREVQNAIGDSGGPVLVQEGGRWRLIAVQNGAVFLPGHRYPADHIHNPLYNICGQLRREGLSPGPGT